ncbi:MAG TPA: Rdx family protein [Hyphomicrobiaceae bacterium]|nr:Rdx family protein [Hyphomicrobiaceae bacterium]
MAGFSHDARDVSLRGLAHLRGEGGKFPSRLLNYVELVPGTGGIFEIKVGDKTVAQRAKGHFPSSEEIVAAVTAAVRRGSGKP